MPVLDYRGLLDRAPRGGHLGRAGTVLLIRAAATELLPARDQDDDAVTLDARGPDGVYQLRARYLVGCGLT